MIVNDILIQHKDGRTHSLLSPPLYVISLIGLGAEITQRTTKLFGVDGSKLDSEYVGDRTITMVLQNLDRVHTSHTNIIEMIFPIKEEFFLIIKGLQGSMLLSRKISCRVKKISPADITEDDNYKVQLNCNDPYFHDEMSSLVSSSYSTAKFKFPFWTSKKLPILFGSVRLTTKSKLYNRGNIPIGFQAQFTTLETICGIDLYSVQDKTQRLVTTEKMILHPKEVLIYDTRPLSCDVYIITEVGEKKSMLHCVDTNSSFFLLPEGRTDLDFRVLKGDTNSVEVLYSFDACYVEV